ncbi:MAG: adenylosuccinate lyase [Firmicutes bacterium HGW-Firmicutes-21]|nr:MAG: adenylosuccinate lyase [Firmicutes bacterium HGW-Firmicutes-21]
MNNNYESPLSGRYASKEMQELFSSQKRYSTWRRLWVALADAEMKSGLPVTKEQIDEMTANVDNIDFERVAEIEKQTRHDVMAHIRAYGEVCPSAAGIIHLGATSCFVTDNTDIIIMREALDIIKAKLLTVIKNLSEFALENKDIPALAYTHLQAAQPTTVGKRAALWLQDFYIDFGDLNYIYGGLRLLGNKGATGTQASFLKLLGGDTEKVLNLEKLIAEHFGFDGVYDVSGQTYTRKEDMRLQNILCGIAQSAYKFTQDMRLLQSFGELEEPFGKKQVGSSAMAYKRNPIRSERVCSLARFVLANSVNADLTASVQWLERSLDDSANRRISLAEGFLAIDSILNLLIDISSDISVYPKVIEKRLNEHLPFMATENILMEAVKKGGDRQELHEVIRTYSNEVELAKKQGEDISLIDKIKNDSSFGLSEEELMAILKPSDFIGLAPYQTERFITDKILPLLKDFDGRYSDSIIKV